MLTRVSLGVAVMLAASPASAQFYKDKTLTLLVNYAAGGNADTEARVYAAPSAPNTFRASRRSSSATWPAPAAPTR